MSELPEFGVDWGDFPSKVTSEQRPDSEGVKHGDKGRKISSYRRNYLVQNVNNAKGEKFC